MTVTRTNKNPQRRRPLWLYAVVGAFLLLSLAVGLPAWAASTPADFQQGTVPPPPLNPGDPGGGGGGSSGGSEQEEAPVATPTPGATGVLLPTPAPSGAASGLTGVVNAPRLNVRGGPGTAYAVLGQAVEGQSVQILFRNATGDWWYICCMSGTTSSGWVSSLFITPSFDRAQTMSLVPLASNVPTASPTRAATPAATPAATAAGSDATVSVMRLNMRDEPSAAGAIIGKLDADTEVAVIARNVEGDWWYVCCAPDTGSEGWVAARFLAPAFPAASAMSLIPLFSEASVGAGSAAALALATSLTATETALLTTTLEVTVTQAPTLALQGKLLELHYVITNTGDMTATAIELRNELPADLLLDRGLATDGARFTAARTAAGAEVVSLLWPKIDPGSALTATLVVTLSATLSNGVVIENLAAVNAVNAAAQTAAISIGLPPVSLPDFR